MTLQQGACLTAIPVVFIAVLGGLLALSVHPIVAVLFLLVSLTLLLCLVAGFCEAPAIWARARGTKDTCKGSPG
jgi:hypothetical protein